VEHNEELNVAEHLLGLPLKHRHKDLKGIGPDDHHREWGWADEWSWKRSIHIPYSKDGWVNRGQVLQRSPSGWDSKGVHQPCVLKIGNAYVLYYTGRSGAWPTTARIGLATSPDGLNFSRYGADGKIVDPPTGDYTAVTSPSVIYDVYETNSSKKYKMLTEAWKTALADYVPMYYYSSDGINWIWDSELSLTSWAGPTILFRFGNAYFLFYRDVTTTEIRLNVTRDFSSFYDAGILFNKGASGEWDDEGYGYLGVFWNLGVWYLFMQGTANPPPPHPWKIGMAISSDGFNWNKYPMNPIQEPISGTWCHGTLMQPCILMVEDMFWLYCCGRDASNVFSLGRFDIVSS